MSAKEEFVRQERDAVHKFMRKHVIDDFRSGPNGGVAYSREYRCGCGFKTDDAGAIFDHAQSHES
jgi:hypothetical protein